MLKWFFKVFTIDYKMSFEQHSLYILDKNVFYVQFVWMIKWIVISYWKLEVIIRKGDHSYWEWKIESKYKQ